MLWIPLKNTVFQEIWWLVQISPVSLKSQMLCLTRGLYNSEKLKNTFLIKRFVVSFIGKILNVLKRAEPVCFKGFALLQY